MDDALTPAQIMAGGASLLSLSTFFFAWAAIRGERDFFLMMGNVCCAAGAAVFAVYLLEQGEAGEAMQSLTTLVACLFFIACYGVACEFESWREWEPEEEEEEAEGGGGEGEAAKPLPLPVASQPQQQGGGAGLRRRA